MGTKTMTSKSDHQLALTALVLDSKKPQGEKPSLLDIDLWRRGKLKKKRAAEVQAFVAHDTDCYQQWLELLENEAILATEKAENKISLSDKINTWFTGFNTAWMGGGLTFATTAALIAVISLNPFEDTLLQQIEGDYSQFSADPVAEYWYYQTHNKAMSFKKPTEYDSQKDNILTGLHDGLLSLQYSKKIPQTPQWQAIIEIYPQQLVACPASITTDICHQQQTLLYDLGQNLALLQLQCSQEKPQLSNTFEITQRQRLTVFHTQIANYSMLSPLSEHLVMDETQNFCGQIAQLLNHIEK